MEEADGRSAIEREGGVTSVGGGGGGGGGDGSSNAARWPCKYESSACRFTTWGKFSKFLFFFSFLFFYA